MKYLISCVIVIISSLIGFSISGEYVKKYRFYKNLCSFLTHLKINISYNNVFLKQSFCQYESEKWFCEFLENIYRCIENNGEFVKVLDNLGLRLKEDEKNEIIRFFNMLGKSDNATQQEMIEGNLILFNNRLAIAEEAKNKNSNVYSKLGVGFGVIIALVVV